MAIIYTYPKLTNPQGNELIVVSDVNNKNSTRLITIADIASLVPGGGGGGCSSAIVGILTGEGNYIAPLCNEVTFTGSGINISADQATATITFTVPSSSISCATTTEIGGIKAYPTQTESGDWPEPSEEGTYYPLEAVTFLEAGPNATCMGAVKIPDSQSYVLPCATNSTLGGIKAQTNNSEISVPDVSESGTYYPIELMKNPGVVTGADCTAIVKVPSGGDPFVLQCATPTALGGIKASKAEGIEVPQPADSGNYYPVQTTSSQDDDDCTAVVRVPTVDPYTLPCASQDGEIGGVAVAPGFLSTPTASATGSIYPIQVTDDCLAAVRIPDSNTPETPKIGFSPMSIYEARNQIVAVSQTYWIQHVISSDTLFNQVDYWSLNGGITGQLTVGVYLGNLDTFGSSTATLIAYGTASSIAVGVNTIELTTAANGASVTAGQDVVVMVSRDTEGPAILGIPGSQYPLSQAKLAMKTPGYLNSVNLSLGETITANLTTLLAASGEEQAVGTSVDRFALHFYLFDRDSSEDSGDGEVAEEKGG